MFLLNFGLLQFMALAGAASALTVALYLLDRSRRRQVVSTLRFWTAAIQPVQSARRRHIQQPWSLMLQLLGILLLILAMAQPRIGNPFSRPRYDVLILETSAWMGAKSGNGKLMDGARRQAQRWLASLPATDRVMLVRADALATPATAFEADHARVAAAINGSQPGATALRLGQAVAVARRAQAFGGGSGEIAFVGSGRLGEDAKTESVPTDGLRAMLVSDAVPNAGLRGVSARRVPGSATGWLAVARVRNYGTAPRTVTVAAGFNQAPIGAERLVLQPGAEQEARFEWQARTAGLLQVEITPSDAFGDDDRATLELPGVPGLPTVVYTARPEVLRPLITANPRVQAEFRTPAEFRADEKALVILDRFAPPAAPKSDAIWIDPPANGSPLPVLRTVRSAQAVEWAGGSTLGAGLHEHALHVPVASVFQTRAGDVVAATVDGAPVMVARPGARKTVVIGFDPELTATRYELATPLAFANMVRWIEPEVFREADWSVEPAGEVRKALPTASAGAATPTVTRADGSAMPFTAQGGTLRFFSGTREAVRVATPERETTYALTLPELGTTKWDPPAGVLRGVPGGKASTLPAPKEIWPFLAAAGGLAILLDALLFAPKRRRGLLALRVAALAAVAIALFQPALPFQEHKVAVAVLADTSASVTQADLERESNTVRSIERERGGNQVTVLPFARGTRPVSTGEATSGKLEPTAGEAGRATDLEAAIRDGVSALPGDAIRRIALLTDGHENTGSVARAIWQAKQLGIPIDTFPLPGRPQPRLRVESIAAPEQVFSGERFPVELTVTAPEATKADIEIAAEGRRLGDQPVTLQAGVNRVTMRAAVNTAGAVALAGSVGTGSSARTPFQYALTVRRPRVLFLSDDPAGADDHLLQVLRSNQFDVVAQAGGRLPKDLAQFQMVVYNNQDMESVPQAEQARLERYEQEGGGLLWIAGEKNQWVDKKGAPEEPLARALPAKLAPPQAPQSKCVVLIIDKSSSMEGKKMDLARLAAIGVVDNLRPEDWIAVLIFDNSFQWAVPLRHAEDKGVIKRLISGILPDGGTQIAPALAEAYRKILPVTAVYKHIVLLTDGISEEGDSLSMAHEASATRVTISTVGLGQDVNRAYLERIAANANGKSYFLIEPNGLEQILLKDVKEHTGTTAVEKPLKPEVLPKSELLDGVELGSAPPLQGYVRFEARPDAEELLKLDKDPLLTRWQYGLGRSAVFASDAKNRWATGWLEWKGFDRFWTNVFRDLLPRSAESEALADFDGATGTLAVTYHLARQTPEPATPPSIFVLGPGGFHAVATVVKVADRVYRAQAPIGMRDGLFRVRPLEESRAFPEVGFHRSEAEMSDFGNDEALLRQVATATGGRFAPPVSAVFDSQGRSLPASMRLWPGLLALAVLLNFAELFLRKWKGLREWMPQRRDVLAAA